MRPAEAIADAVEAQRGAGLLWAPVALGAGIGLYFSLGTEPGPPALACLAALGLLLLALAHRTGLVQAGLLAMVALGVVVSALQTERVRAPVLSGTYFGPVVGRVVALDRSASNALRLTLDRVHLPGREGPVPEKVRVSLAGHIAAGATAPGARVMMRAWLSPPNAPVEPGDFDFRRHAWFDGLGAVGFSRDPVVLARATAAHDLGTRIFALRRAISQGILARLPGAEGAFATAILTGDRSEIDPQDMAALRASNLAHLLAISGLHMGLLTGFVFAALRLGLALCPPLAMRLHAKKLAAAVALLAGLGYLALSGAEVATQRAFIMAAVALGAILLDRPALTLRSVAIAALIVLTVHPVSLLGPGFQMSFAATTALIAAYDRLRRVRLPKALRHPVWAPGRWVVALAITSAVAGLATAPFSAFHFNAVSRLGYLANLAAVPAMGLLVMPAAVVAGLLTPLGLEAPALAAMAAGIRHILSVAEWTGAHDGALWHVPAGPPVVLALIALGGLAVSLLRGGVRLVGLPALALALAVWTASSRPDVLVTPDGRLVGVRTEAGRALTAARGNRFAATIWLENDGAGRRPERAYLAGGLTRKADVVRGVSAQGLAVVWTGSAEPSADLCGEAALLIAPKWAEAPPGACVFVGAEELAQRGAHAVRVTAEGVTVIRTVGETAGQRPWTFAR